MFLGVILDGNLSWKPKIANIAMKVSNSISAICKSSLCLPTSTLCTLYNSLVYPYLLYCITVWGSTYPSRKGWYKLYQVSTFNPHTEPIFKQLKILNLYNMYWFQIGKIMFLFKIGHLPDFFLTFLTLLKYIFVWEPAIIVVVVLCVCVLSFLTLNILYLNHAIKLMPHFCKIWGACSSYKPLGFPTGFLASC